MSNSTKNLSLIRAELKKRGLDGFLVPRGDAWDNEEVRPCDERLAWVSGFTGSAGIAAILEDRAAVLTNGIYTLQVKLQVDNGAFEFGDTAVTSIGDWVADAAKEGAVIGYDPWLHTSRAINRLRVQLGAAGISLKALDTNPIDTVWQDRPPQTLTAVAAFPQAFAGYSREDKIAAIADSVTRVGAQAFIITQPESVAWLLNIRGNDLPHNPFALSYAIIYEDGMVDWFIDAKRLPPELQAEIGARVRICAPNAIEKALDALATGKPVWLDQTKAPHWFTVALKERKHSIYDARDPIIKPRACKSPAEQEGMRAAHVRDGAALCRLLAWIDSEVKTGALTELAVEAKMKKLRGESNMYRGDSFAMICGWAAHGAIIHYRAKEDTNVTIQGDGLIVLDTGGQYDDGTTDVTRTIVVGTPTAEMKDRFTRVLKGHIAVARARFPQGVPGAQIDILARQPLWEAGIDYPHGTGHGVGCYLSVHEEAASISPRGTDGVLAGMVISNEPGYYKENAYGIRLENLVLANETGAAAEDGRPMLAFETLTFAPFDKRAVEVKLLTAEEKAWLNVYHQTVRAKILPLLADAYERDWLLQATDEI